MLMVWLVFSIFLLLIAIGFVVLPFAREKQYFVAPVMGMITLLSALLFYSYYGQAEAVAQWLNKGKATYQVRREFMALGSFDQVVQQIKNRITQNTADPQGWFLLGRLYYTQGLYHDAVDAFSKAYALKPEDPSILLNYARSLYFEDKKNKGKARALAEKANAYNPGNTEIKEFLELV